MPLESIRIHRDGYSWRPPRVGHFILPNWRHNYFIIVLEKTSMLRALLVGLAIPVLIAAQVPRNRAPYANEQWVQLFNGKDLTGWVNVGHEKWTAEEDRKSVENGK